MFFWIVEVVIVNSYILYTAHTDSQRKLKHREFRGEFCVSSVRWLVLCNTSSPITSTWPDSGVTDNGPVRRDCWACSVRGPGGEHHLTNTFCSTCSGENNFKLKVKKQNPYIWFSMGIDHSNPYIHSTTIQHAWCAIIGMHRDSIPVKFHASSMRHTFLHDLTLSCEHVLISRCSARHAH